MNKAVFRLLTAVCVLLGAPALAQNPGVFQSGQVYGNSTASTGQPTANSLTAMFNRAFCSVDNSAMVRLSGSWACLASANNSVWATNGSGVPALTTTLPNAVQDNITRLGTIASGSVPAARLTGQVALANGGTAASLAASNGGLVYSDASAFAVLAGTGTANRVPLSGTSAAPSWSTATYPATAAAGTLLGASSANLIAATATPTLGANGGTGGQITLNGSTSGSAVVKVAAAAGTTNFQLPVGNGTNGFLLSTDGAGVTSWISAPGSGTVTSVNCNGGTTVITTSGTCASPEVLSGARTYYIRVDGNDTNCTGLTDAAYVSGSYPQNCGFLTIQKGVDISYKTLDWAGYTVTLQVRDGTYTGATTITGKGIGQQTSFSIVGNTGTPNNVLISTTSADGFTISNHAVVSITGMKIQTTTGGNCITNQNGGILTIGAVNYGASAGYHISSAYHAYTSITSQSYTISGAANAHYYTTLESVLLSISNTVTITGTPAWGIAFLVGAVNGYSHVVSTTFSGASTGLRFYIYMNHVYSDGSANAYNYLPGNAAGNGISQSGAVYNNDYEYNTWQSYTPTIAGGAGTTATAVAQYKSHGKDLHFNAQMTITAGGAASALAIPFPTVNNYYNLALITPALTARALSCVNTSAPTSTCVATAAASGSAVNVFPTGGTFTNGHVFAVTGTIEIQ